MRILAAALVIICGAPAPAQSKQHEVVTQACKAVEALPAPKAATVPPPMRKPGEECDPLALYYGMRGRPDYASAEQCALAEWHNTHLQYPEDSGEDTVFAIGTLTMMYANGDGIPRDVDRAIRIACAEEAASVDNPELDELIAYLLKVKADPKQRFDFCAAGIYYDKALGFECTWISETKEENLHQVPLEHAMAGWTPAQRNAYVVMMKARDAFVIAQVFKDGGCGSGLGEEMSEMQSRMRIEQTDAIVRYESGKLPHFSHDEYIAADKKLNRNYAELIASLTADQKDDCATPPQPVRQEERAWVAYRDEWVKFAKVRWPQVSAESWLAQLTRERITQLNDGGH